MDNCAAYSSAFTLCKTFSWITPVLCLFGSLGSHSVETSLCNCLINCLKVNFTLLAKHRKVNVNIWSLTLQPGFRFKHCSKSSQLLIYLVYLETCFKFIYEMLMFSSKSQPFTPQWHECGKHSRLVAGGESWNSTAVCALLLEHMLTPRSGLIWDVPTVCAPVGACVWHSHLQGWCQRW